MWWTCTGKTLLFAAIDGTKLMMLMAYKHSYPCTGLDRLFGLYEPETLRFARHSVLEGSKVSPRPPLPQQISLVLISVRGWFDPQYDSVAGRTMTMKNIRYLKAARSAPARLYPSRYPWYLFLLEADLIRSMIVWPEGPWPWKNSHDPIGCRTRDIAACSAVPHPTVPP